MHDLSNHAIGELRKLELSVAEALRERQSQEVLNAREQILKLARDAGIDLSKLVKLNSPLPARTGTVKTKYRHPDQPGLQWTGRGRQPGWVREWLAAGRSLDEAGA